MAVASILIPNGPREREKGDVGTRSEVVRLGDESNYFLKLVPAYADGQRAETRQTDPGAICVDTQGAKFCEFYLSNA